jgi:hypothetical protein
MITRIRETDPIASTYFGDDLDGVTITLWLTWDPGHPGDSGHIPLAEFKSDILMSISEAIQLANSTKKAFIEIYSNMRNNVWSREPNERIEWEIKEYQNDDESLCLKHNII